MNQSKEKAFSRDQIEKIGNTIIYLCNHIPELSKTKILKVLFLLEEASIKKFGYPFFGIDFQLWKHGPVAKDIFIDLSEDSPSLLKDYIERNNNTQNFVCIRDFNDDEFSDNDLELLKLITSFAQEKSAKSLVQHTHSFNSLWRKSAIKEGVLELLEQELINSTEFTVDFSLLFEDNNVLLEKFNAAKENADFVRHLKA